MSGVWVAPVGTDLDDMGQWADIGYAFDGVPLTPFVDWWGANGYALKMDECITWKLSTAGCDGKFVRVIMGYSKKEYRIVRGVERKQLLHKGGKP